MQFVKILQQIGIVLGICLLGEGVAQVMPIPFPASVISMILLFIVLLPGRLKPDHLRQKADFLTQNMALFFIPAGVGVMKVFSQIKDSILPLLLVCVLTSVITFGAAALTVRAVIWMQDRMRSRAQGKAPIHTQVQGESRS